MSQSAGGETSESASVNSNEAALHRQLNELEQCVKLLDERRQTRRVTAPTAATSSSDPSLHQPSKKRRARQTKTKQRAGLNLTDSWRMSEIEPPIRSSVSLPDKKLSTAARAVQKRKEQRASSRRSSAGSFRKRGEVLESKKSTTSSFRMRSGRLASANRFASIDGASGGSGRYASSKSISVSGRLRRSSAGALDESAEVSSMSLIGVAKNFREELAMKGEKISFIVLPDSLLRTRLDTLLLVVIVYTGLFVPYNIAFTPQDISSWYYAGIGFVCTVTVAFDVVITFRTGFLEHGVLQTSGKAMAIRYLKGWFAVDFLAAIPVVELALLSGADLGELRVFSLFQLFRIMRFSRILERFQEFSKYIPALFRLVVMFFVLVFFWHWIACTYWIIAEYEDFGFPGIENLTTTSTATAEENGRAAYGLVGAVWFREHGNKWLPPPTVWCEGVELMRCNETYIATETDLVEVLGFNPFQGVSACFGPCEGLGQCDDGGSVGTTLIANASNATGSVAFSVTLSEGVEISYPCPTGNEMQYAFSFFWALMATTGVGRDVMPVTKLEHGFTTLVILIGVGMFVVIVGSATSALSNLDPGGAERRERVGRIALFMKEHSVPKALQQRIFDFYEYMFSRHVETDDEGGALSDLHPTLKLELDMAMHRSIISRECTAVCVFRRLGVLGGVVASATRNLGSLLSWLQFRAKIFIPGEYIILEGEVGSEMYVVIRGEVQVLMGVPPIEVAVLSDGHVFGEQAILHRQKRNATIRAITFVEALILGKTDFDEVMLNYPDLMSTLLRIMGLNRRTTGWQRVRDTLKTLKTCRYFGSKLSVEEMLLGPDVLKEHQDEYDSSDNEEPTPRKGSKSVVARILARRKRWNRLKIAVRAGSAFKKEAQSAKSERDRNNINLLQVSPQTTRAEGSAPWGSSNVDNEPPTA